MKRQSQSSDCTCDPLGNTGLKKCWFKFVKDRKRSWVWDLKRLKLNVICIKSYFSINSDTAGPLCVEAKHIYWKRSYLLGNWAWYIHIAYTPHFPFFMFVSHDGPRTYYLQNYFPTKIYKICRVWRQVPQVFVQFCSLLILWCWKKF